MDLFDPCVYYGVQDVHFTFISILLAEFFQNVTSINLSATVWSPHAFDSIKWIMLEKLIWNKCLCYDLFLPHLGTAANLLELQLDNPTLLVNDKTGRNLFDLITDDHEFTIFHHLNTCIKLKIFSCAHCRIHWYRDNDVAPDIYLMDIGHFCTRWLLRSAPLSLREYTGPIFSKDRSAVMERYCGSENSGSGSAIFLNPQPLDNVEYFNDEGGVMVPE